MKKIVVVCAGFALALAAGMAHATKPGNNGGGNGGCGVGQTTNGCGGGSTANTAHGGAGGKTQAVAQAAPTTATAATTSTAPRSSRYEGNDPIVLRRLGITR